METFLNCEFENKLQKIIKQIVNHLKINENIINIEVISFTLQLQWLKIESPPTDN